MKLHTLAVAALVALAGPALAQAPATKGDTKAPATAEVKKDTKAAAKPATKADVKKDAAPAPKK